MAFIPVPNTYRCELLYSQDGKYMENVFNFSTETALDIAGMTELGSDLIIWEYGFRNQYISNHVVFEKVIVTDLSSQNAPGVEVPVTPARSGGVGLNDPLPANVTVAVRFVTGLRGRAYRGRSFVIGMTKDTVDGDTINGTFQEALVDAYEALMEPSSETGAYLVVVSRQLNGSPRTTGVATPVTSIVVDPTVDSQRRRLSGRGA